MQLAVTGSFFPVFHHSCFQSRCEHVLINPAYETTTVTDGSFSENFSWITTDPQSKRIVLIFPRSFLTYLLTECVTA